MWMKLNLSALRLFFPLLKISLFLLKSGLLRRRSENRQWKGKFPSSYKGALARALSSVA
jgi:hypothetical protein